MKITLTLNEILDRCSNWDLFCEESGYSVYVVNDGGGHIEVTLSEEEAIKYGILKTSNSKAWDAGRQFAAYEFLDIIEQHDSESNPLYGLVLKEFKLEGYKLWK